MFVIPRAERHVFAPAIPGLVYILICDIFNGMSKNFCGIWSDNIIDYILFYAYFFLLNGYFRCWELYSGNIKRLLLLKR